MWSGRAWTGLLTGTLALGPSGGDSVAQEVSAEIRFHAPPGGHSAYFLSLPHAGGLEDVAHSALADPCELGGGPADGALNADDLICTIWGAGDLEARHGLISVLVVGSDCRMQARTAFRPAVDAAPVFVGAPFAHEPESGFVVRLVALPGQPEPDDRVTFTGPCEPTLPASDLAESDCPRFLLNLPYDTSLRTADEILCGVEGVDWVDDDLDGAPDTCTEGLFGSQRLPWKTPVTVQIAVNAGDLVPRLQPSEGNVIYLGRSAFHVDGRVIIFGHDFDLLPGDGPWVHVDPVQDSLVWDPPVEGCD